MSCGKAICTGCPKIKLKVGLRALITLKYAEESLLKLKG